MRGYAPIGSLHVLNELLNRPFTHDTIGGQTLLGKYHLVLVNEFLKDERGYRDLFLGRGWFIILDNSAVEQGYPSEGLLAYAANRIGAQAVCVPDYLEDLDRTIEAAARFFRGYKGMAWDFKGVMLIPQGKNLDEIELCARNQMWLAINAGVAEIYWGVPRWMANKFGTRKQVIELLCREEFQCQTFLGVPNIHLLGMSKNFTDDLECARMDCIMGMDSANPVVMGQQGKRLWTDYVHMDRPPDFFEQTHFNELTAYNVSELRRYINRLA